MSDSSDDYSSGDEFMGDETIPSEVSTFLGVKLTDREAFLVEPENPAEMYKFTNIAVDPSCTDSVVSVQVDVDGGKYIVATLRPGKVDQAPLNLEFNSTAELSLAAGKGPVHLVGVVSIDTELFGAYADSGDYSGEEEEDDEDDDDDEDEEDLDFLQTLYTGEGASDEDDESDDSDEGPKIEDVTEELLAQAESGKKEEKKQQQQKGGKRGKRAADSDEEEEEDAGDNEGEKASLRKSPKKAPGKGKKSQQATPIKKEEKAASKSNKSTPKKSKDVSVNDMLKKVLEAPNKPKSAKKFKNHAASMFKLDKGDPKIAALWEKYQKQLNN